MGHAPVTGLHFALYLQLHVCIHFQPNVLFLQFGAEKQAVTIKTNETGIKNRKFNKNE